MSRDRTKAQLQAELTEAHARAVERETAHSEHAAKLVQQIGQLGAQIKEAERRQAEAENRTLTAQLDAAHYREQRDRLLGVVTSLLPQEPPVPRFDPVSGVTYRTPLEGLMHECRAAPPVRVGNGHQGGASW